MDVDFKNKMKDLSHKINVNIEENDYEKFYIYMKLLLEWNEKINLTAITEKDDIILKHFIDSMTVLKYINENEKIVDVGTGAGFPGVPISILNQNIEITLLDSLNKRILFLEDVVEKLNLKNVNMVHCRAEDFGKNKIYRESYDISISRAVANLATLSEYLLPLVKVGGKCICMKGANIKDELENAKFAIEQFGGKISKVDNLFLPDSDMERNIVIIEKIKDTPKLYPRKAGIPLKNPLVKN